MADLQEPLERDIAEINTRLAGIQKKRLFTSDPIEQRLLETKIEALQKNVFELRRLLGTRGDADRAAGQAETVEATRPLIFVSYCQMDREWLDRLLTHLNPSERSSVEVWDDLRIEAGMRWRDEIDAVLKAAKVAVVLVSADYLASEFIADNELPFLLEAAQEHGTHILPIIVSPCSFERTVLNRFQAVNAPSSPLTRKSPQEQESTFARVAEAIHKTLAMPLSV